MHIFDLTRILRRGCRHEAGHGESVFVSVGISYPISTAARVQRKSSIPTDGGAGAATAPRSLASAHASDRGVEEGRLAVQGVKIAVGVLEKRPPIPSDFVGFV